MDIRRRTVLRILVLCAVGSLLGPAGGCGIGGYSGGTTRGGIVGGAIRPRKLAYAVTPDANAVVPGLDAIKIPSAVDLRREGLVPPVQNQTWNSCVGWSLGYYTMSAVIAREMKKYGKYVDMSKCENWFSPEFLYSQRDTVAERDAAILQRASEADPMPDLSREADDDVACMRPEEALRALFQHGICPWSWLSQVEGDPKYRGGCGADASASPGPVDGPSTAPGGQKSRAPWQYALGMAASFRPRCYVRFGELDDLEGGTAKRLRAWLADQGTPVSIVVKMASGWVTYRRENRTEVTPREPCGAEFPETRGVCLDAASGPLGSEHMMTIIGYDTQFPASGGEAPPAGLEGSFLVVNQWGDKWGDLGTMWIPCTELAKIWVGGYGIIGSTGEEYKLGNDVSQKPICFQDETGAYIEVSGDGNDVAANLLTADERWSLYERRSSERLDGCDGCDTTLLEGLPQVPGMPACAASRPEDDPTRGSKTPTVTRTACRLAWPAGAPPAETTRDGAVGGKRDREAFDSADWYYFEVPKPAGPDGAFPVDVVIRFETDLGDRTVQVKITDDAYVEIGAPAAPSARTRGASASVRPGVHFVKLAVPNPGEGTAELGYSLTLRVGAFALGQGESAPTVYSEFCVDRAFVHGQLDGLDDPPVPPGPGKGSRDLYQLQGVGQGVELRVQVRPTATPPAQPDLELLVMVQQGRIKRIRSARIGADGGAVRVAFFDALGRGEFFVGVRNLSNEPVDYDLDVDSCGAHANDVNDPDGLTLVGDGGGGQHIYFFDPARIMLRDAGEFNGVERRNRAVELTDFADAPEIVLVKDDGTPMEPTQGFEMQTAWDNRFAYAVRVIDSLTFDDTRGSLRFSVVRRCPAGTQQRLVGYTLRTFQLASLAAWPEIDEVDFAAYPSDGNNDPSHAEELRWTPAAGPITVNGASIGVTRFDVLDSDKDYLRRDYWDFYRVVNGSDAPQRLAVTFRLDTSETSAALLGYEELKIRSWRLDSATNLAPVEPETATTNVVGGQMTFDLTLAPGETTLFQVERWTSYHATYSVTVAPVE